MCFKSFDESTLSATHRSLGNSFQSLCPITDRLPVANVVHSVHAITNLFNMSLPDLPCVAIGNFAKYFTSTGDQSDGFF